MLIIGTRGSKLAIIQAELIASMLLAAGESVEIKTIVTSGDIKTPHPSPSPRRGEGRGEGDLFSSPEGQGEGGVKGLFVKEIEEALLAGEVDIAVHSMKDVPGMIPAGLSIVAIPKREDPRDVFLSDKYSRLNDLPENAKVGTSSPRRQAQLKDLRPDLQVLPLRGNVDTRIRKLNEGQYDAIILAAAGLIRLGMQDMIREYIPVERMIPSVGQGALAVEVRKGEKELIRKLHGTCHHEETAIAVRAERAFLKTIGGDCHTPLAAYANLNGNQIHIVGYLDGKSEHIEGPASEAEKLGRKLAEGLKKFHL